MKINSLIEHAHMNALEKGFWGSVERFNKLKAFLDDAVIPTMEESKPYLSQYLKKLLKEVQNDFITFHRTTLIMLMVTELAEGVEGLRKGDTENHAEEMADTVIRIADYCGGYGIDLEKAIVSKMERNKQRPRLHGKRY